MAIGGGRTLTVILGGFGLLAAGTFVALATGDEPEASALEPVDWETHRAAPTDSVAVYWVGHSLFIHRDSQVADAPNLMEEVGRLADARSFEYRSYDNTLFGVSLSIAVAGEPHQYERPEPELARRLDELRQRANAYDALVLTETIPVRNAEVPEHSAYYAMVLHCLLGRGNPNARTYLYEGPVHLQGSDPEGGYGPRDRFDWTRWTREDRVVWERIADQAQTGQVPGPTIGSRVSAIFGGRSEGSCRTEGRPIFLIPAATVLTRLAERLAEDDAAQTFQLADGEPLTIAHLYQNPYADWPREWPLDAERAAAVDEAAVIAGLERLYPGADYDDIHPSRIGTFVNALTTLSVLYRRNPAMASSARADARATGLTEPTVRALQAFVWEAVRADPRTGVRR